MLADGSGVILLNGSPKINLDPAGNIVGTLTPPPSDATKKLANTEFVRGSMGNKRGFVSILSATVLDESHIGKMVWIGNGAAVTLPPANSVPAGSVITLFSLLDGCRVSPSGGDTLHPSNRENNVITLDSTSPWAAVDIGAISIVHGSLSALGNSVRAATGGASIGCPISVPVMSTGQTGQWIAPVMPQLTGACIIRIYASGWEI